MRRSEEEGVRRLLGLGWRLLRSGQAREAADAFGRVLVRRPDQPEAQQGAVRARQAAAEEERLRETEAASRRRHRPAPTASSQRRPTSATTRTQTSRQGTETDVRAPGLTSLVPSRSRAARSLVWGRRILLASSSIALVVALAVMHLRWDALMSELCRPPMPSQRASAALLAAPAPSAGQRTLMEARRKIESGDAPAAQRLLQSIVPEDPAYPFAQRMQLELPQSGEQP